MKEGKYTSSLWEKPWERGCISERSKSLSVRSRSLNKIYRVENFRALRINWHVRTRLLFHVVDVLCIFPLTSSKALFYWCPKPLMRPFSQVRSFPRNNALKPGSSNNFLRTRFTLQGYPSLPYACFFCSASKGITVIVSPFRRFVFG